MPWNVKLKGLPKDVLEGHRKFLQEEVASDAEGFAEKGLVHDPKVMWIGCCDARVSPARILKAELGSLFVLRNIGSIVPPPEADAVSVGSALAYAVDFLRVEHIIVCGHIDCGGMKALSSMGRLPLDRNVASWVEYALPALEDVGGEDLELLTKTHVVLQLERLQEYSCVSQALGQGRLKLHGCYYDTERGELERFSRSEGIWKSLFD